MMEPSGQILKLISPAPDALTTGSHFLSGFYENLTVIGLVVVAMIAIATPIVKMIQKTNSETNTVINKNDTESYLYQHLKEQIENQKRELDRAKEENTRLWEMIKGLEARLSKLEHIERNFDELKLKLTAKDEIIVGLQTRVTELENLNSSLELDNVVKTEQITHLHSLLEKYLDSVQ